MFLVFIILEVEVGWRLVFIGVVFNKFFVVIFVVRFFGDVLIELFLILKFLIILDIRFIEFLCRVLMIEGDWGFLFMVIDVGWFFELILLVILEYVYIYGLELFFGRLIFW